MRGAGGGPGGGEHTPLLGAIAPSAAPDRPHSASREGTSCFSDPALTFKGKLGFFHSPQTMPEQARRWVQPLHRVSARGVAVECPVGQGLCPHTGFPRPSH